MHTPEHRPEHDAQPTEAREALARRVIHNGIEQAEAQQRPVDTDTARVLAAALHGGARSPLERFAATGRLDPQAALHELHEATEQLSAIQQGGADDPELREQLTWLQTLTEHVAAHADDPQTPRPRAERPGTYWHPVVYVTRDRHQPGAPGAWIDATAPPGELTARISEALAPSSDETDRRPQWTVAAAAGFFDLEVPTTIGPQQLSQVAIGIADYGEAFAAFIDTVDWDTEATDEDFLCHYAGTFADTESLGAWYLGTQTWHRELDQFTSRTQLSVDIQFNLDEVITMLTTDWHIVHGIHGIHVFRP